MKKHNPTQINQGGAANQESSLANKPVPSRPSTV
jgi:hypothetical protein